MAWEVIKGCRWQLRVGMSGAHGLDFAAVMAVAAARGADSPLLAEVLPSIEAVLMTALRNPDDAEGPEGED